MTETYWDRLIHGHLDDLLNEAEQRDFESLMRDSEAARARFWELAEVHALARDAARIAWPEDEVRLAPQPSATVSAYTGWAWLQPTGLVAAGLLVGVLMTSLAWAISWPQRSEPRLLLSESFESTAEPAAKGVPTMADEWSGDFAELVEAQTEVQPASGMHMLRFVGADYAGKPNPGGYIGEIYRLIDVRSYRPEVASGDAVVQVAARFNAAPFSDDETYRCSVSVFAFDQATATDATGQSGSTLMERALATTRRSNDLLDHDSHTWQKVSADLLLPPNTDFLLLRIALGHGNSTRKSPGHETFAAHFADDVQVSLTRRPPLQ